ncbi:MAG: 23S rRNA (guanosine(2251)-2'-O)-methyltransferase RlmB [Candidatus Levybacteria bacterium CG10_big_fil_rev_8_21_14_0_10_36_7]|nr:MAG: 23S rRNA (guanosine(2251)-2'-O)-methyltransferase RlmB [Candidatus Levybacteria bacterium CG10_big_fil_rev_8_21_14_0_10_36_7]
MEKWQKKAKKDKKVYIYGKHALMEALLNAPQIVQKVFLASNCDNELNNLLRKNNISISELSANAVSQLDRADGKGEASHQGVIAQIDVEKLMVPYKDFISNLQVTPDTVLVLLDELQDPQNVGAIIRSAAAFGVAGVFIPKHNQAPVTGSVVKVSAGMAFRVPIVAIGNVNNTVRDLKKKGFWIYGLDGTAEKNVTEEKFEEPTVFIMGNEGKGIRQKTLELCDFPISIPMNDKCESLNAAAAAAVSFYAWSTRHPGAIE